MYIKELPDITKKQEETVNLVLKFRFINRKQIQKILGHKDAHRINAWLKDLVEKKYLGRIYSHKLLENTKPAIYYLDNMGILWVKKQREGNYDDREARLVKKFYADKKASQIFIDHSVFLCDLFLQFKELEGKKWEYECMTKTDIVALSFGSKGYEEEKQYFPDMAINKLTKEWDDSTALFLDLFPPHIPKYALEYKVRQYIKLKTEERWHLMISGDGIDGKFPKLLFVLPSQGKVNRLAKYIQERLERSYDVEDMVFALTTYKKALEQGIGDEKTWKEIKDESS